MITQSKLSGYGTSSGNIQLANLWHKCFRMDAEMRFLPGAYTRIADICIEKNDSLDVGMYNFSNESEIVPIAVKYEAELRKILAESGQIVLTVRFNDDGVSQLLQEEFTDWHPHYQIKDEMFTYTAPELDGGFPNLYFMAKECRVGINTSTLDVMAHASHEVFKTAGNATEFGKELMYSLINSKILGHFDGNVPPISNMDFPTNGRDAVSTTFNTDALKELVAKTGVDKLPANPVEVTKVPSLPEVSSVPEVPAKAQEKEDVGEIDDRFHQLSNENFEDNIIESVMSTGLVSLQDICSYGISETLDLTLSTEFVIEVVMDIPDVAKKMMIYMGKVYVVPYNDKFSGYDAFGESEELFEICTIDSLPKNIPGKVGG